MKVHLLPGANRDLEEYLDYLDRVEPGLGDRFLGGLEETLRRIGEAPGVGASQQISPQLAGVRSWHVAGFRNWLVFYRERAGEVHIIRIIHGARDLPALVEDFE